MNSTTTYLPQGFELDAGFRALMGQSEATIAIYTLESKRLYVLNRRRFLGFEAEHWREAERFGEAVDPLSRADFRQMLETLEASHATPVRCLLHEHSRAVPVWVRATELPAPELDERVCCLSFSLIDAHHERERFLKLLESVVTHTNDAVALTEATHADNGWPRITWVNRSFTKLNAYPSQAILSKPLDILFGDATDSKMIATLRNNMQAEEPTRFETQTYRSDGTTFWADWNVFPVHDHTGFLTHWVCMQRDTTERRELLARMMRMDRFVATGGVAAAMGHEINNPLTFVTNNLDFAWESIEQIQDEAVGTDFEAYLEWLSEAQEALRDALEGSRRIRDIVTNLKTFLHDDGSLDHRPVALRPIIESCLKLAAVETRHRARVEFDVDERLVVRGRPSRLSQVFLNLLTNAAQSIPPSDVENQTISVSAHRNGDQVVVRIDDTGEGIAAEALPRIFEPFFTTRRSMEGTGLGLSICAQIVDAHSGTIDVEETGPNGTTFCVRLPAAEWSELSKEAQQRSATSTLTLLVVDDEPAVLRALKRQLPGFNVDTIEGGRTALAMLRENPDRYDIILSDLIMPDLSGIRLYNLVTLTNPDLGPRFIFMTGGAFTPESEAFSEAFRDRLLLKPFGKRDLLGLIDRVRGTEERE